MRRASVYLRKGSWFISPMRGIALRIGTSWGSSGPFVVLPGTSSSSEKGEAALHALGSSRDGVTPQVAFQEGQVPAPDPKDWNFRNWKHPAFDGPGGLYELAGVKGWVGFSRGALSVEIEQDNGQLRIIPHGRAGQGFSDARDIEPVVIRDDASPQEIGEALAEAVSRCE